MPEPKAFHLEGRAAIPAQLVAQARTDAASIGYAKGWAQGLADARRSQAAGLAAGLAAVRAEQDRYTAAHTSALGSAMSALAAAAAQLEASAVPTCEDIEDTILAVAVELAEALLGRELREPHAAGLSAIARVLQLAPSGEAVTVRLNPADQATLTSEGGAELVASIGGTAGRTLTLEADAELAPGDAVARCGATTIDARLSAGLHRLQSYVAR